MRFLDPKVDLPFKRVFGEHAHLLKSFLNALLPLPEDQPIVDLEYLPSEQVPELPGLLKNSIVDVKCKDSTGRTFIVEMQMLWTASFEQRMVFSASQAYVKQLKPGQGYNHLGQVYALALINDTFEPSDNYYHHYQIVCEQEPRRILKGLEFVFVELPKFKVETHTDKRMQALWLRFMNLIENPTEEMRALMNAQQPELQEAIKLIEIGAYTEGELEGYHRSVDRARVEITLMEEKVGLAVAQAKAQATKDGMQQGIQQGIQEGIAQGAQRRSIEIARALKAQGLAPAIIAQATGLDLQDITQLEAAPPQ
jgi:predicted transposase/invertase (TIGR01784 family)